MGNLEKAHLQMQARKHTSCIRLYGFIAGYYFKFGIMPSYRDMSDAMDGQSTSVIRFWLGELSLWGWIASIPKSNRTLRLTRPTELRPTDACKQVFIDGLEAFTFETPQVVVPPRTKDRSRQSQSPVKRAKHVIVRPPEPQPAPPKLPELPPRRLALRDQIRPFNPNKREVSE